MEFLSKIFDKDNDKSEKEKFFYRVGDIFQSILPRFTLQRKEEKD